MESIDSEKSAYARATYRTEYATATAAVIFLVMCHRGRTRRENHAGSEPRFTACSIWLCVYGRKDMGYAAATAPWAFAAEREAPGVLGGRSEERSVRARVRVPPGKIFHA